MKILRRASRSAVEPAGIVGIARVQRDNAQLGRRLKSGDIAVIDHPDLDRAHAEALIARKVRAVVNVSPSSSGRYPNLGPQLLAQAGITIIDHVGPGIWAKFKDRDKIRIDGGNVYRGDIVIATGTELDEATIVGLLSSAQSGLSARLESLAANSADHIRREHAMLLEGAGVPRLHTDLSDRPVVVVSKSYDYADDLAALKRYISGHDAVLIGAGAGADALLDAGYTPAVVVGDLDNVSDRALKAATEVIVASSSGQLASVDRLEKAGADAQIFRASGSDEDLALLLADSNEASVIVLVGGHTSLVEFLDKGPLDMSSTFLTRLRVGAKLVDAKAVAEFYNHRITLWPVLLLLAFAVIAVGVAVAVTPVGDSWVHGAGDQFDAFLDWARGLFS